MPADTYGHMISNDIDLGSPILWSAGTLTELNVVPGMWKRLSVIGGILEVTSCHEL